MLKDEKKLKYSVNGYKPFIRIKKIKEAYLQTLKASHIPKCTHRYLYQELLHLTF